MAGLTSLTPGPTTTAAAPTPLAGAVHLQPQFDPLEYLPPAAADRLRALRQRRDDLHAIIPAFEQVHEASMARVNAQNDLTRLVSNPGDSGFNLPPSAPQVIAAPRTLDKADDEFKRLQERQATRSAQWQAATQALSACEAWLKDRPGGVALEDWDGPEPQLLKGEKGLLDAIENRRRRVRELKATMHTIRSAPMPSNHAKAKMRAQIEALAMQGVPDVTNLIEHDAPVDFQTQRLQSEVHTERRSLAFAEVPDTLALFAWLHRDALIKKLDAEIAAEADDAAALSHEERQRREAEVLSDILACSRDESALVWLAQSKSLPVEHRADCSPLAILQVRLVPTAATDGGGSSWMHSWDVVRPGGR